jgi:hypothetical protein
VLELVRRKTKSMDGVALSKAVHDYGGATARKFFAHCDQSDQVSHAV